ncbi:MAG: hypothetical protein ACHQXL_06220, partial [Candidatus Limnocylindrales bacterium]
GSHDVPAYGFERIIDPPPLEVNTLRLMSEFQAGSIAMAETWAEMFAPTTLETVLELAGEAGKRFDDASRRLGVHGGDTGASGGSRAASAGPSTHEMADALAGFHFPDDVWARLIYDLVASAGRLERASGAAEANADAKAGAKAGATLDRYVAALVPIYFGRVASFVVENRDITTDEAEERVERQAREFELLKPYLVERWNAG